MSRFFSKLLAPSNKSAKSSTKSTVKLAVMRMEDRLTPTVGYYGGGVLPNVEVQNLYLGSDWNQSANMATASKLDGYTSYLVGSPFMSTLYYAGYKVSTGTASPGRILNYNINKGQYLFDSNAPSGAVNSTIQGDIEWAIHYGGAAQPDANRLYVVYVEPGVAVSVAGETSQTNFLGYHGAFRDYYNSSVVVHYAVIDYPGGYNPTSQSQYFPNDFGDLTAVASHEIAESATDPNITLGAKGWYDASKGSLGEIGDIAVRYHQYLNGYYVQLIANGNDQPMALTTGTVYQTPNSVSSNLGTALSALDAGRVGHHRDKLHPFAGSSDVFLEGE
jgi:hypothetical protein